MSGLQKYLDELSSTKSEGAVSMLIRRALIDRNVFFYGQLCNNETVASIVGPTSPAATESKTIFEVLKILTYGTWKDLTQQKSSSSAAADYINGNPEIAAKLRKLTLLTVAERTKSIPYSLLEQELGIKAATPAETSRIIEDVIIDSTTAGLITVTLNPQQRLVQVHDAAARDVNVAEEVPRLLALFKAWGERCEDVVYQLQVAQQSVHQQEQDDTNRLFQLSESEWNERRKALRKFVEGGNKMQGGGGGLGGGMMMGGGGGNRMMMMGMGGGLDGI